MPPRNDLLIAAALAALMLLQVTVVYPIGDAGPAVALVNAGAVAFRRVHPVAASLALSLAWLIPTDGYLFVGYVSAFLVFFALGAYVADKRTVIAVATVGFAVSVAGSAIRGDVAGEYFGGFPAVVLPVVAGRVVRRVGEDARRLAVAEERARIARELHDVVAHGISVIAVQADAAEAALDRDPELARGPLTTIRASARESLAEMRQLLGVLREDGDGGELAPQPGLGQLAELIEHARGAGVDVHCEVAGEPRPLARGLDLSAYRIVQEALTNVRKHAHGAPATVRVEWAPETLALQVRDSGPGHAPNGAGHGLIGMRERVKLHGGELHAGPARGGGFEVSARLPA